MGDKKVSRATDKDIRKFFDKYNDKIARVKILKVKERNRGITEEETEEIKLLEFEIEQFYEILNLLPDLQKEILTQFFMDKKEIKYIAMDLCFNYEYTSSVKVKGCQRLRELLNCSSECNLYSIFEDGVSTARQSVKELVQLIEDPHFNPNLVNDKIKEIKAIFKL